MKLILKPGIGPGITGSTVKEVNNFDIIGTMDNSATFTMPSKDAVVTVEVNPDRDRPTNEDTFDDNKASCTVTAFDPANNQQGKVTIIAPDEWPAMKPFNFTVKVEDSLPYGSKDKDGHRKSKSYNLTCSTTGQGKRTMEYDPFDPTGGVQTTEPVVKSWSESYNKSSGSYEISFTYTFPGTGMVGASWTTVVLKANVTHAGSATKTVKIKPRSVTRPELQLTR